MAYGNSQFRQLQQSLAAAQSPFASSIRQAMFNSPMPTQNQRAAAEAMRTGGLGALFGSPRPVSEYDPSRDYNRTQPAQQVNQAPSQQSRSLGSALDPSNTPQFDDDAFDTFMGGLDRGQQDMINMFAKRQGQQQMQQMMQQRQMQPRMGMGIGGMRPTGMGMFGGFPQQPQRQFGQMPMRQPMPMPRGGYNQYSRVPMQQPNLMQQPNPNNYGGYGIQQQPYQQQQYGMMGGYQQNPYQQQRPQPQQFGGYGMGQSMGGYGGYGGMQNSYAPQQYGQQSMGQPQQFGRMY